MDGIKEYSKCVCGALTVYTADGKSYSCKQSAKKTFFPGLDLRKIHRLSTSYCCDHCVNHYGLDLCGCGSGEKFGHCHNGLEECKIPMQVFGEYDHVRASDAWI